MTKNLKDVIYLNSCYDMACKAVIDCTAQHD